jgi:hypothetical protein
MIAFSVYADNPTEGDRKMQPDRTPRDGRALLAT